MWQRIQTLYLIFAMGINLLFFVFGLANATMDSILNRLAAVNTGDAEKEMVIIYASSLALIICLISVLLSAIIIFLFKRRQIQIKLGQLNLLLQVALIVSVFMGIDAHALELELGDSYSLEYKTGTYLSIIPLVFIYLAIRAIKKDEALIRAADRIR